MGRGDGAEVGGLPRLAAALRAARRSLRRTFPVLCRRFLPFRPRPLVAALHSIFQRGDVGGADEADGGFVRFAVLGDDHRFQRLVIAEHRIDIVK